MSYPVSDIQKALNGAGYGPLKVDGVMGNNTKAAIRAFQKKNNLMPDGIVGRVTAQILLPHLFFGTPNRDEDPSRSPKSSKSAKVWPRQKDVVSFFGAPGSSSATAGRCLLKAPMRIAWDKSKTITRFSCHEKVAEPMTEIFAKTIEKYGESKWRSLGLDLFGGCYNYRAMRGGTKFSMHAYGIAVDIDPERNQLKWGRDRAELAKPVYDDWWRIVEDAGAISLGRTSNFDWMHWQFARL